MDYGHAYWQRVRSKLIAGRGGSCEGLPGEARCESTEELEFAHVAPTELNGRGRGYPQRVKDVRDHPAAYRLLCKACHWFLDFGNPELPDVIPQPDELEPALSEGENP